MKVKVNDKLYFATIKKIDEISRQEAGLDKAGSYYECRIGLGLKPCGKCVFAVDHVLVDTIVVQSIDAVDDDSAMAIIKLIKKYCLEKLIMDLTVKPEDSESKFKDVYAAENGEWLDGLNPHARDMMALSEKYFRENRFIDIAYSTPNYLKEYQTTVPKNKVLNNN